MRYIYGVLFALLVLSASAQDGLKRPDIPGELMVDIGFNVWSSMPGALERRTWSSKSVALYYTKRKAFSSKLSLNYGIGLGLEKMSLGDSATLFSNVLVNDTLNSVLIGPNPQNFDKNKLATTYLDIPIEFRFHPMGTEDGEGLFLGVGGIVGLRLNAHTKWKYNNNGETVRDKVTGKFNLNSIRYGYQVRAGFRGVHVFYKRYVSPVFNDTFDDGFDPVMSTIGINVTGF
ncbi:outer membrane beta-barrel protein [Ekhidna sp. To15]|uniref:outer membrane beta-barrel protein n=1 Tax=Ekhidna sp. To15 TaxID=3395267 RepID=UPI003F5285F2